MPLYEYACEKCNRKFEVIQKFSDEPLTTHDQCGGKVHRLLSAPALQFKGSGWYVNDYAKSQKPADKPADNGTPKKSDAPAGGASSSGSGSESAPASTASSESKSDTKSTSSETK